MDAIVEKDLPEKEEQSDDDIMSVNLMKRKKVKEKSKRKTNKKWTPFKCDICSKHFTDKYLLKDHADRHTSIRAFACNQCPFTCKTKKYLARHVKNVHSPPAFQCQLCGKKFNRKEKLETHTRVHTGEKPFECRRCGKCFSARYSLKTHMYLHTDEKPFKCAYCPYACRDSSTLRKHQQRHLGIKSVYQCKTCGQEYTQKYALKNHVAEVHLSLNINKHKCGDCSKMFRSKSSLSCHKRQVHDKSQQCKCELCGRTVGNKSSLKSHMRTHVDARPFTCKHAGCGKSFKDSCALHKHEVIHDPSLHYPCEICGRTFSRYHRLVKHIDVHAPQTKRVECDYCGVKFLTKNYLIKHIRQKHARKRQKFKCDMCEFVTHNKPSIVMHVKYAHARCKSNTCEICGKSFKKMKYLNDHCCKYHGIKHFIPKTKRPKPRVDVKIEPVDETPFEHEIKQEIPDELTVQPEDIFEEAKDEEPSPQENQAKQIISSHCKTLSKVPEELFDEFYIEKFEGPDVEKKTKHMPDPKIAEEAINTLRKMVAETRQRNELRTLERTRLQYNERMRALLNSVARKPDKVQIKHFDPNKYPTNENTDSTDEPVNEESLNDNDSNEEEKNEDNGDDKVISESDDLNDKGSINNKNSDNNKTAEEIDENVSKTDDGDSSHDEKDEYSDNNKTAEEIDENESKTYDGDSFNDEGDEYCVSDGSKKNKCEKSGKVKFNTHQCYICFKLYETKEKLLDHCKDHFDVCNNITLKKCPLCEYVTKLDITRHIRAIHKVSIKLPYTQIKDKKDNTDGSRYYYEVNNAKFKKLEIIPSVRNLNKIAQINIEKKARETKNMMVAKTKLVKKGKDWIVERENIDISKEADDHMLPEVCEKDIRVREKKLKIGDVLSDKYVDRLMRLYKIMKKKGVKMLFPCEGCDKICQTASALKLHERKHDTNPKPFRPKVWKHKFRQNCNNTIKSKNGKRSKPIKVIDEVCVKPKLPKKEDLKSHRESKPKPIVNKHKCDPQLKEFYEKNIRGGNIEFWQFLKIFNKMGREKINDFKDLEQRYTFGIHFSVDNEKDNKVDIPDTSNDNEIKSVSKIVNVTNESKKSKKLNNIKKSKNMYKRVIRISKAELRRRKELKDRLREKITREKANTDTNISLIGSSHQAELEASSA